LTVLVEPEPSTIWRFAPVILIVGFPSIPELVKETYGRIEISVCWSAVSDGRATVVPDPVHDPEVTAAPPVPDTQSEIGAACALAAPANASDTTTPAVGHDRRRRRFPGPPVTGPAAPTGDDRIV
jgi:hypothetical protein